MSSTKIHKINDVCTVYVGVFPNYTTVEPIIVIETNFGGSDKHQVALKLDTWKKIKTVLDGNEDTVDVLYNKE